MAIDPDLVRVDLLRARRLIYKSYPDGSPEQKEFLLSSKRSELKYLSEVTELMFGEYKRFLQSELVAFIFCLSSGLCLSAVLFGFHELYPKSIWLAFFMAWPLMVGLYFASYHTWHIVEQWKKMQPFKKDFVALKKKIAKLNEELENIK